MKVLEKKMKSNWDFILYRTDECYVLNVTFCNSFVDVTRSFKITDEDAKLDFDGMKQLAENIRQNQESYKDREITPVVTM